MATERDRVAEYKEAYDQANAGFGAWQMQVKNDLKVYLGDSWTSDDRIRFKKEKRDVMGFPLIRRLVKWISGYQRRNIKSIRYDAVEGGDEQTAEQFTALNTWSMQHSNSYYVESEAFEGCLKQGINLINVYNNRNFDTKAERFGYNQFLLDPTFTRRDLDDCHYGMLRKYITKAEATMLLPGRESIIKNIDKIGQDEMYPYYTRPQLYGEKLLSYDEFQQRTTVEKKIILIKPTNKEFVWQGSTKDLRAFMALMTADGIPSELISVFTRWEPTVEVTVFLEGKEVTHSVDPYGISDFSFTPVIAYFDPDFDRMEIKLQSVIRGLVDSQRAADKRMMSMMAMFEQQVGSGLDYEEDALVDDEDAFITGPGKPRQFRKDALTQGRARDRVTPDIPAGMFQLHDLFDRQMPKSLNINDELTGFGEGGNAQVAGFLAKLRMQGGLVGLEDLFDNLSWSRKTVGEKRLKLYQQYPLEKVKRVLDQEPSQEFVTGDFGKYDAATVEGIITDTQRNMFYNDLIQLKELGLKLQDPAPISWPMLMKNAPVAMKGELMKEVEQNEQKKQEAQQKQEQMQQQSRMLEMERVKGEILGNRGIAEERRAQAVENMSDAALNRAKTAAEIEDLATGRAIELLQQAIQIEQINQQNVEAKAKS